MLYQSSIWLSDLDAIISSLPEMDALTGHSILITGARGLICSALVDVLIRYNETHNSKIGLLIAGRNEDKIRDRFKSFCEAPYFKFIPYDANDPDLLINDTADYIVHGAGNASPNAIVREPVETMTGNVLGLLSLLNYARDAKSKRVLFISSSEVYGRKEGNLPFQEDQYGFIDILSARNSYSVGKRASETLCIAYSHEYQVESVIVRPGHIYGPTALTTDNRVSSLWAYNASRGQDIIMKSEGKQIRSYCYCLDCASAIIKVLIKGESCQAYNISNPNSVLSIYEMARLLAQSSGVSILKQAPSEKESSGFNPMNNSSLDSTKLELLGWKGLFDAKTGFDHTIRILRAASI